MKSGEEGVILDVRESVQYQICSLDKSISEFIYNEMRIYY